ncbi:MAG: phosphohydrolase [Treponema sp.]|jgi:metal-dependent HD superfamily phosphatase/phosphodiesterase|nr:phosphohydrolase [Treponema sp.]
MRSPKEIALDQKIISAVSDLDPSGKVAEAARLILQDEEIQCMQEYANTVSIKRLGYNDHGPVHMRTVAFNVIIMMGLLQKAHIKTNLEKEECGTFADSLVAVLLASSLHDVGMTIGRQDHEIHGSYMAYPIADRILKVLYPEDLFKRVVIRSLVIEGISGHMGTRSVHSLEAGIILVADGCDMKKGRARIPMALNTGPKVGDIHKYSANAIESVKITAGQEKPIRIEIHMSSEVGIFQIEEVLLGKINVSPAKPYVELFAVINETETKQYL